MNATARASPEGHCDAADYKRLIEMGSPDVRYHAKRVNDWQAFVARYPDLRLWHYEPLAVRIGRLPGEHRSDCTSVVNYNARTYLIYLGLTGRLALDYDWLLAMPYISVWEQAQSLDAHPLLEADEQLVATSQELGYHLKSARRSERWVLARVALHTGKQALEEITVEDIADLEAAIEAHCQRPDLPALHGSLELFRRRRVQWRTFLHTTRVLLFHVGRIPDEPRVVQPQTVQWRQLPAEMDGLVSRYRATQRLALRASTMQNIDAGLRRFTAWLSDNRPDCVRFSDVTRDIIEAYMMALNDEISSRTGKPLAVCTKRALLQALHGFFRNGCTWGWEGMPVRSPMGAGDLPRIPFAVPRYIPTGELERISVAIRGLDCPFQRAALLTARWCGARRGEIRRLDFHCLDEYPHGTPRLRIPAGKTYRERLVPLNPEAAQALRDVMAIRERDVDRPFTDTHSSRQTRYLFVRYGKLISLEYLFATPLRTACTTAGLVTPQGRPLVSSHRFRHTVGTNLAERGAKLHTIMAVLGHRSASMSLVYAQISDQAVLHDYESVLGPTATLAGPYATAVRAGALDAAAVDWLKTNFLKTELELGRCLRLPQEGPCECDLALTCAKFVTTPQYAPRLTARRALELELVADAERRGWSHEAERHRNVVNRLDQLLCDLGTQSVISDGGTDSRGFESRDDRGCSSLDSAAGRADG